MSGGFSCIAVRDSISRCSVTVSAPAASESDSPVYLPARIGSEDSVMSFAKREAWSLASAFIGYKIIALIPGLPASGWDRQ